MILGLIGRVFVDIGLIVVGGFWICFVLVCECLDIVENYFVFGFGFGC